MPVMLSLSVSTPVKQTFQLAPMWTHSDTTSQTYVFSWVDIIIRNRMTSHTSNTPQSSIYSYVVFFFHVNMKLDMLHFCTSILYMCIFIITAEILTREWEKIIDRHKWYFWQAIRDGKITVIFYAQTWCKMTEEYSNM